MENYYEPEFVEQLFDDMSKSYSNMNLITSFGFSERWRRQCVAQIKFEENFVVVDLMTGMGECWHHILQKCKPGSKLIALDFSSQMIAHAEKRKQHFKQHPIDVLRESVFNNSIASNSADCVISGFGLKTFNRKQLVLLAREIRRILKPEGSFSLIDVSVPDNRLLKGLYMFYLKNIIPTLGRLFLGNPETYKMLGIYTESFKNARMVEEVFKEQGFAVQYREYFFGCATGVAGIRDSNPKIKPNESTNTHLLSLRTPHWFVVRVFPVQL
ncbi:MAG: class I SAM-dependent methyltransferase [Saprospiraceae bacterium]